MKSKNERLKWKSVLFSLISAFTVWWNGIWFISLLLTLPLDVIGIWHLASCILHPASCILHLVLLARPRWLEVQLDLMWSSFTFPFSPSEWSWLNVWLSETAAWSATCAATRCYRGSLKGWQAPLRITISDKSMQLTYELLYSMYPPDGQVWFNFTLICLKVKLLSAFCDKCFDWSFLPSCQRQPLPSTFLFCSFLAISLSFSPLLPLPPSLSLN